VPWHLEKHLQKPRCHHCSGSCLAASQSVSSDDLGAKVSPLFSYSVSCWVGPCCDCQPHLASHDLQHSYFSQQRSDLSCLTKSQEHISLGPICFCFNSRRFCGVCGGVVVGLGRPKHTWFDKLARLQAGTHKCTHLHVGWGRQRLGTVGGEHARFLISALLIMHPEHGLMNSIVLAPNFSFSF
jgi:hypothetical protein